MLLLWKIQNDIALGVIKLAKFFQFGNTNLDAGLIGFFDLGIDDAARDANADVEEGFAMIHNRNTFCTVVF